jgi:hypothetical protein
MRKSPSFDVDSFGSHTMSGADLSHYQDELARERNARTLTLRRPARPTLSTVRATQGRYGTVTDAARFPLLAPDRAATVLKSGDAGDLSELASQIISASAGAPRPLKSLVHSPGFLDVFNAALAAPRPPELVLRLLDATLAMLPSLGDLVSGFVDGGVFFALVDFLASPDGAVVTAAIRTLRALCEHSSYARDSALCLEVHTILVELAINTASRADDCCAALLVIFSNPEPIEAAVLIPAIDPLFRLLAVNSHQAVATVFDCFVAMTNQHSALVHPLYDLGMFPLVVNLLDDPNLVSPALRLIGNLSVAQPVQLRTMLDAGLVPKLIREVESDHAADVFWVLSNLLEAASLLILPLIEEAFVKRVFEIIESRSYDIQKESAFFLSTLILFSPDSELPRFVVPHVIDVLVSMIGCGVEKVVLRCIDTVGKLVRWLQSHDARAVARQLAESDLLDRLEELLDDPEQPLLAERADALSTQVRALLGGKNAEAE